MKTRLALLCGVLFATGYSIAESSVTHVPSKAVASYAIVASQAIMEDAEWRAATVDVLGAKYPNAQVYTWKEKPEEVREALAKQMPMFTAFVVKPEEAGVYFTIGVHHLCRSLDDDPYGDTFWGVITGYDAPAAKVLAEAKPIAIRRALDCAGCDITAFNKAWRYSEDHRGIMNYWEKGVTPKEQSSPCNTDNTRGVLERLQKDKVQFVTTSGHATQHDWQMGYRGPNMALIHKEGKLIAVDTKKAFYAARNLEPKVYFGTGNCLIGDIDKTDCMALSWMRDGGARQFMGYTVTTWFGAQGWGTQKLFVNTAGLCTANEAFHFTNAAIVHELEALGIPELRDFRFEKIEQFNMPKVPVLLAWGEKQVQSGKPIEEVREAFRKANGNLHDRDTVCFYGDPALEARIADGRFHTPLWEEDKGCSTATLLMGANATDGTLWVRLPKSMDYNPADIVASEELGLPDLALDNMLRFPNAKVADLPPGADLTITIPKKKAP